MTSRNDSTTRDKTSDSSDYATATVSARTELLFISDLHLSPTQPQLTQALYELLAREQANSALKALYVLGDLFDYWLGDDDTSAFATAIQQAFRQLSDTGVELYFMRGNRDFTLGDTFARACGGRWLAEFCVIPVAGQPTLLLHGDAFCTDDTDYQRYKRIIRHPLLKRVLLNTPRAWREQLAKTIRGRSEAKKTGHYLPQFDVNEDTVKSAFLFWSVTQIIHGHTHRPKQHAYVMHNQTLKRYVLGDWGNQHQAWTLRATDTGLVEETFALDMRQSS